uniref:Protein SYS1 homolog n=1 Tax=Phaeocystis antarctica TaxID=33657 RepID=A0A7S0HYH8_9EUKA|mmetsp:Transcript_39012/g.91695  ORF Transcript_39012/g.91695 Transcript_39012/m.91695 type:complete len:161 (+) Transcript_39012:54-536(+)
MFYVQGFDPALIISQIVSMQTLLYMHLGLWLCVLTALGGSDVSSLSLGNFFSSSAMSISFAGGWIAIIAFFLNALAGSFFLCLVVERAKKCLDFTTTAHILHLCFCVMYDGFPASWEWWAVNLMSLIMMALLGEYLCMRRELQDIPLFGSSVRRKPSDLF